jgi:hypothetical protein
MLVGIRGCRGAYDGFRRRGRDRTDENLRTRGDHWHPLLDRIRVDSHERAASHAAEDGSRETPDERATTVATAGE